MSTYYDIHAGKTGYIPLWKSRVKPGYNERMRNKQLTVYDIDMPYLYHTTAIIDNKSLSSYIIPNLVDDYNSETIGNYHLPEIGHFSQDLWNMKHFDPMPSNFWIDECMGIRSVQLRYKTRANNLKLLDLSENYDDYYDYVKFIDDNPHYNIDGIYEKNSGYNTVTLIHPADTLYREFEIIKHPKTPYMDYADSVKIVDVERIYDNEFEGESYELPIINVHTIII